MFPSLQFTGSSYCQNRRCTVSWKISERIHALQTSGDHLSTLKMMYIHRLNTIYLACQKKYMLYMYVYMHLCICIDHLTIAQLTITLYVCICIRLQSPLTCIFLSLLQLEYWELIMQQTKEKGHHSWGSYIWVEKTDDQNNWTK